MARPAPWSDAEVSRVRARVYETYGVALVEFTSGVELGPAWTCTSPGIAPGGASAGSGAGLEHIAKCTRLILDERDCTRRVQEEMVRDFWEHRPGCTRLQVDILVLCAAVENRTGCRGRRGRGGEGEC